MAVAHLLDGVVGSLSGTWHEDRAATRDLVEQIMALHDSSTDCPADTTLSRELIRLRGWAAWLLNNLADSAAQAILIGERLVGPTRSGCLVPITLTH